MTGSVFAQTNLLKREYFERQIQIGDTIILCYDKIRNIYPTMSIDKSQYIDGLFYTHPKYDINDKRKKHPIFTYRGTLENEYTPSNAVADKKMVVLSIKDEQIRSNYSGGVTAEYTVIYLYNTIDEDTIMLLQNKSVLQKTKPYDYIKFPQYQRILSFDIMRPNLYTSRYGDTSNYDLKILTVNSHRACKRIIYDTWTQNMYFKKITITDVSVLYKYIKGGPQITITYKKNDGSISQNVINYYKQYDRFDIRGDWQGESGIYMYSADDISSMEIREKNKIDSVNTVILQEKRNAGDYHFELTKVEKPRNQNVKKGRITNNAIYEDNIISIKWDAHEYYMRFDFMLKNMTNSTMRLLWDETIIVNFDGFTERVLHKGADIEALQKSQQPAIIPALAQLSDFFCSEKYFGDKRLKGGYGGYNNGGVNDGKEMRLMLPVQVGSTTYTYTFTFTLKWKWKYPELREQ